MSLRKQNIFTLTFVLLTSLGCAADQNKIATPSNKTNTDSTAPDAQRPMVVAQIADKPAPTTTSTPFTKLQAPWKGLDRPSNKPGDFYVALTNEAVWQPDSSADCVDDGVWSWFRKIFNKQDAQVSIIANIKSNTDDLGKETNLPLFLVAKNESAKTN